MKIIVAVSGGVDSCVMLDTLVTGSWKLASGNEENNAKFHKPNSTSQLIVAHVDHGLRKDSAADARFVEALADKYGLQYEQAKLRLDDSSEATARAGRWQFLRKVKADHGADAIATAHHVDDVIETMLINLLRGTHRKGLTSLSERAGLLRPLLTTNKQQIYRYAIDNNLEWVKDSTNASDKYLRNRVRRYLVPQLTEAQREKLLNIYDNLTAINSELDRTLIEAANQLILSNGQGQLRIETDQFSQLSEPVKLELFATWWWQLTGSPPPDSLQLERMVAAVDIAKTGNLYQMANGVRLQIRRGFFELYQIKN